MRRYVGLITALALASYSSPAFATTWYTDANLDFSTIRAIGHNSKLISAVSYFTIIGNASGVDSGIQGVYESQDQNVMRHCLHLAEQLNLTRKTGSSPLLRIQVKVDPANASFALIQYCTLYQ